MHDDAKCDVVVPVRILFRGELPTRFPCAKSGVLALWRRRLWRLRFWRRRLLRRWPRLSPPLWAPFYLPRFRLRLLRWRSKHRRTSPVHAAGDGQPRLFKLRLWQQRLDLVDLQFTLIGRTYSADLDGAGHAAGPLSVGLALTHDQNVGEKADVNLLTVDVEVEPRMRRLREFVGGGHNVLRGRTQDIDRLGRRAAIAGAFRFGGHIRRARRIGVGFGHGRCAFAVPLLTQQNITKHRPLKTLTK